MMSRLLMVLLAVLLSLITTNTYAAFGRTAGNFGVSSTGGAQYSIPIWTPSGPRGIQPSLSLTYSSQSGIGPLGVGWSVSGLGAIIRCNKTSAQDTVPAPVALLVTDGYCLNGNRLRLTGGTYGSDGSTYQTEIADFSLITANGTAGNGPATFTVRGKNGLTYQYGLTDTNGNGVNSAVLAGSTATVDFWLLSKVLDRYGNNYVINYVKQSGSAAPDTMYWTPASAGAASYVYTLKFNYGANVPQSSISKYISGTAITNNQLLMSISISGSGTVLKDYFYGYQASPTTGRNELISITECADAAKTNCLLPTAVTYQNGAAGVSSASTTAFNSSGLGLTARYDLNGDGIPDLLYNSGGAWYVQFGAASGFGSPVLISSGVVLIGNITGGNKDGILATVGGVWWYYLWNGSTFVGSSTGLAYDSTILQWQLADIDGDGLPDLVGMHSKTTGGIIPHTIYVINVQKNLSSGTSPSFSTAIMATVNVPNASLLQTPDTQYGRLRHFDFNGDGRDDLVIVAAAASGGVVSVATWELISTGTGFTTFIASVLPGATYQTIQFGNWNDDACTDFVAIGTLYISGCNGSNGASFAVGSVVAAMDWDGDGRTDLVVSNGANLGVYLSTGGGVSSLIPTNIPYVATCQYVTTDANGDGLDDLGCWSQTAPGPFTYRLHNGASQLPDLVSSIKDGYGNSVTPTYVPLTTGGVYSQYTDAVFPYKNYIVPTYVTSQATFSDPSNLNVGTYNLQYYYYGAWSNLQGRGFQSFYAMRTFDSRNALYNYQYYQRAFPYTGMEFQDTISNGTVSFSQATRTPALITLDSTANNQRYFPYFASSTTSQWEAGGSKNGQLITTTASSSIFDNYGNITNKASTITDNDTGSPYYGQQWTSTMASTIAPQIGTWCLGLPTQTTVTNAAPGVPTITRTVGFTPDYTVCRETAKIIEPSSSAYKVTDAYSFDSFGNVQTDTVTGVGMAARVSTMGWGTTGQFLTTLTKPLTPPVTMGYDLVGDLISQTDPNSTAANPIIMTSGYNDGFFRKTSETRPDGTSTGWTYNNCATVGCVNSNNKMTVTQTNFNTGGSTQSVRNDYLDSVGRSLVSSGQMLNGAFDRVETQYDNLGRVHQQSAPCAFASCAAYWSVNTYDILSRMSLSQRPISASNSTLQSTFVSYAGHTTIVTDAQGKSTVSITKVTGSVGRTQDHNGYYVNFNHDAFGSVLSITDSLSNTLRTMTYDYGAGAFARTLVDMDLGSRGSTYDALGEVVGITDGLGHTASMTYDALSRPFTRTEPEGVTTWNWGSTPSSVNIGRLASVTSPGYSESETYDNRGRLATRSISSDATYNYGYTYNATTGLLDTLTYPTSTSGYSLKLQYGYVYGRLNQIKDANAATVFWQANTTNARGQVTQETLGNGVVKNEVFDPVTGWIGSIQAGVGGGAVIQNESYLFDLVGNVTQRQNNNAGLTENFYYDNLYRLDHSTLAGTTNLQMGYDATGNITSRSDIAAGAAWTYDPARKHAMLQAGSAGNTMTYDANGNAITRNGSSITWSSYNYPTVINGRNKSMTFSYGSNRQRYLQVYTSSGTTESTMYVGGLLEKVTVGTLIDWRHYIRAGNKLIAIMSRQSTGINATHYMLADHEGSIAKITDATGALTVAESFSAFGTRRNSTTWSGPCPCPDATIIKGISRVGFTGQDAIGGISMGLNHMNGRVEDAILGRFLSPDPLGTNPSNTQSYNRYSYVQNQPLTLMDPTGFEARTPPTGHMYCMETCNIGQRANAWKQSLWESAYGGMVGYRNNSFTRYSGNAGFIAGLEAALHNMLNGGIFDIANIVYQDAVDQAARDRAYPPADGTTQTAPSNPTGGSTLGGTASGTDSAASGGAQSGCYSLCLEPNATPAQGQSGITYGPATVGSFGCGVGPVHTTWVRTIIQHLVRTEYPFK